jgi:hypothetical protein
MFIKTISKYPFSEASLKGRLFNCSSFKNKGYLHPLFLFILIIEYLYPLFLFILIIEYLHPLFLFILIIEYLHPLFLFILIIEYERVKNISNR